MQLILTKKQATDFVTGMQTLNKKFRGKYISGDIIDVVELSCDDNANPILHFKQSVPEMVRLACYRVFLTAILQVP